MPIYEYLCRECEQPFEELLTGDEKARCPACGGERLEKRFSSFAVADESARSAGAAAAPGACGTCGDPRGPGSCAS